MKTALILAVGLYLAVALAMYLGQRWLIYLPETARTLPRDAGLEQVEEKVIETGDGAQVIAWYAKARAGQPTLLYFHGNAGSLESRQERIRKYSRWGRGIFMMSYRGYSGSTGSPSEQANVADGMKAFDMLVAQGVPPAEIIIYGESLGSGVAVQVAAAKAPGGLILDAPYTSLSDVAAGQYPWLPVRPMLLDRYDSQAFIKQVHCPLLIVHGEKDETIPVSMGRKMYALANEPKQIATFKDAGHADHYMYGSYDAINAWIDKFWPPRAGHAAAAPTSSSSQSP
ncbi:MAG: alpha/beta hydrolase [Hyphomicrobium sp.]